MNQADDGLASDASQKYCGQAAATAPTDQANAAVGKEPRVRGRPKCPLVLPLVDSEPANNQRIRTRVRRLGLGQGWMKLMIRPLLQLQELFKM